MRVGSKAIRFKKETTKGIAGIYPKPLAEELVSSSADSINKSGGTAYVVERQR